MGTARQSVRRRVRRRRVIGLAMLALAAGSLSVPAAAQDAAVTRVAAGVAVSSAALADAARSADWDAVMRSLASETVRADVDQAGPDGTAAIHWAVRARHEPVVRALIEAGADLDAANRYGETPLSLAARDGNADLLEILLAAGADPAAAESALADEQTLAMLTARTGSVAALEVLAAHGAIDVHARESRNQTTAMMWAALDNRAQAIGYLADLGADPDARTRLTDYPHLGNGVLLTPPEDGVTYVGQTPLQNGGWTALMFAARSGAVDAVGALAAAGADLDARDPLGESALTLAIINGHWPAVEALLAAGANPNIADDAGSTPLYAAVDFHSLPETYGRPAPKPRVVDGSVAAVSSLLAAGAEVDARLTGSPLRRQYTTGDGRLRAGATPLMRAAAAADVTMMRVLLEGGAKANAVADNGTTPLLLAAAAAKGEIGTPDYVAAEHAVAAVELLLAYGGDPAAADRQGRTAAHLTIGKPGAAAIIRLLAEHGGALDAEDERGRTPLALALETNAADETVAVLRQLATAN